MWVMLQHSGTFYDLRKYGILGHGMTYEGFCVPKRKISEMHVGNLSVEAPDQIWGADASGVVDVEHTLQ
jgi:hypothetical protein